MKTTAARMPKTDERVARCPFTVLIDSREQWPFTFEGISAGGKKVIVPTQVCGLKSGDYSIEGLDDRVVVERKSVGDLYGTLTHGRERFERELDRLAQLDFSAVVIEGSWYDIGERPPFASKVHPSSIVGTIHAWQQRYPKTHWLPAGSRKLAERATYGILRRFYLDNMEKPLTERKEIDTN